MKTNKAKKLYKVESADGKLTVRMLDKGTDGRVHSVVVCLPSVEFRDGKQVKLTRKTIVERALADLREYYPVLCGDGKGK